jgi:hypothetical protein
MKTSHLIAGVGVLAVAAGILYWTNRDKDDVAADPRVGQPLLSPEVVAATAEIRIHSAGELAARLARGADGSWRLPDHWEMPVNMDNLGRLISRLTEVDVVRFVTARAERLARLEPDSSAIAFHPEGDAAAPLLTIRLGKRADSGGMYLQFDDEPVAYLASEAVFPSTSPDSWTERRFMPFAAEDIRAINLVFDGEGEPLAEIRLERPAAGAGFILPDDLADAWQLQQQPLEEWLNTLATLRFSAHEARDAGPVAEAAGHARRQVLEAFDGTTWEVTLARRPERVLEPAPDADDPAGADAAGADPETAEPATEPAGKPYVWVDRPDAPEAAPGHLRQRAFEIPVWSFTRQPSFEALLSPRTTEGDD